MEDRAMTQKEFEERTGKTTTNEQYKYIEELYMAAGDTVSKDTFCEAYRKLNPAQELVMDGMLQTIKTQKGQYGKLRVEIGVLHERISGLVEFLIGKSRAYNDTDFRTMAVRLAGEKEVVLKTLDSGVQLWEEDMELIKRNLRN